MIDTYWDYVCEIAQVRGGLNGLINLNLSEADIAGILERAGFVGYRLDGALGWITRALKMIRDI
ncbi:MAG: hypothetical protein LBD16_00195 [Oscillospiraceae bacterium]|jgi:hypothetical protein|nr:hypothetical protein [Oscillospiraceae bacterium]